jgi:hypothetical protein
VYVISLPSTERKLTRPTAKYIVHDVEIRGASILRLIPQEPESIVQYWRSFFSAITNGGMRVWISIAAVCSLFLGQTVQA